MATKLGHVTISRVKGATVEGVFTSFYEENVYEATLDFALMLLIDAAYTRGGEEEGAALEKKFNGRRARDFVVSCEFSTPGAAQTRFCFTLHRPRLLKKLRWFGAGLDWESYRLG